MTFSQFLYILDLEIEKLDELLGIKS